MPDPAPPADALTAAIDFPFLGDAERVALLQSAPPAVAHAVLREAEWGAGGKALQALPPERVAELLKDLQPDQAAGLLSRMSPEARAKALPLLPMPLQGSVRELLDFPEGSVARRMNPYLVTIPQELPAGQAFEILREAARMMPAFYAYVVDRQGVLVGTASLRKILGAPPETPVGNLMERHVVAARALDRAEEAAALLRRHRFLAVPVVDQAGRPLGVVTNTDLADLIEAEADREVYSAAGVHPAEEQTSSLRDALKGRLPWFGITLSAGLGCALMAHGWESRLLREAARVFLFAPLILALGESIGTQTGLVILRLGTVSREAAARMIRREMGMGLLIGLGCAAVVAAVAGSLMSRWDYVFLMGLSIPVIGAWSAAVGVLMPGLLRRNGGDPALAAGPLILALVDLSAMAIYLGLAAALLD